MSPLPPLPISWMGATHSVVLPLPAPSAAFIAPAPDYEVSRFGLAVSRGTSVRIRFGSPFSSKVVVCGHCLVRSVDTVLWLCPSQLMGNIKMALVAAHLNAGVILAVIVKCSNRYIIISPPPPTPPLHSPFPLPVPNKPYGFCAR